MDMFTGIVETTGQVKEVTANAEGRRLQISAPGIAASLSPGESVSVSGVCLTVEQATDSTFTVFLAQETVARTVLGTVESGDLVNLERAMAADGRFDGHLVQGHVDGTTTITAIEQMGEDWRFSFDIPDDLEQYLVEKGSVALDGISLTIASRDDESFAVAIIPTTYTETTLHRKVPGDKVHIEVDVVAKYVESMVRHNSSE